MKKHLIIILMVVLMLLNSGCSKVVPPGTTIIRLSSSGQTSIYEKGSYVSYGRDRIYFIDTKLKSFTETMNILCKDKVNIKVDIKWIGSFNTNKEMIQQIIKKVPSIYKNTGDINGYELSLSKFYNIALRDIVRASSRLSISPYKTDIVPENRMKIQKHIKKIVFNRIKELNYPILMADLMISNLDFDPVVSKQRQAIKKAELDDQRASAIAKSKLAQCKRDEEIAMEESKAVMVRARAKAEQNKIISVSITPNILAMKQWEVLETMAKGNNNQTIVVPYEALKSGNILKMNIK